MMSIKYFNLFLILCGMVSIYGIVYSNLLWIFGLINAVLLTIISIEWPFKWLS